jgi:hypothetical protein
VVARKKLFKNRRQHLVKFRAVGHASNWNQTASASYRLPHYKDSIIDIDSIYASRPRTSRASYFVAQNHRGDETRRLVSSSIQHDAEELRQLKEADAELCKGGPKIWRA